jgi:hypothetical protein
VVVGAVALLVMLDPRTLTWLNAQAAEGARQMAGLIAALLDWLRSRPG